MNRSTFFKQLLGASLLPAITMANPATPNRSAEGKRVRKELLDAWHMSERMTLITAGQMPAGQFGFKYTAEAMSFAQQWMHCCNFTIAQLASRFDLTNPDQNKSMPIDPTKEQVLDKLKALYQFVNLAIEQLPDAALFADVDYLGETVAGWRLFGILENHIIHHRGQCMVYLRLSGTVPEGYLGW